QFLLGHVTRGDAPELEAFSLRIRDPLPLTQRLTDAPSLRDRRPVDDVEASLGLGRTHPRGVKLDGVGHLFGGIWYRQGREAQQIVQIAATGVIVRQDHAITVATEPDQIALTQASDGFDLVTHRHQPSACAWGRGLDKAERPPESSP